MAKSKKKLLESDLYPAVHDYLAAQGYTVRSEVLNCDVTAAKDNDLIVVELKRGFTIDLLVQSTKRQKAADSVYVAVPRPEGGIYARRWRGLIHLLKRLELGLIIVSFLGEAPHVEVVFHPLPYTRPKSKKTRRAIIREMNGRSGDYNQGGSTQKKLVTAYRENVVFVACCLDKFGPLRPKQLSNLGTGPKTQSILSSNFYDWFDRIDKGVYELKPTGKAALDDYPRLVEHFRAQIAGKTIDDEPKTKTKTKAKAKAKSKAKTKRKGKPKTKSKAKPKAAA